MLKVTEKLKQTIAIKKDKNKSEQHNVSIDEKIKNNEIRKNFFFKSKIFGSIFTSRSQNQNFREATSDIVAKLHRKEARRRSRLHSMKSTIESKKSEKMKFLLTEPSQQFAKDF